MNYFHYTIEGKAHLIMKSGALIPTGGNEREKPMLWFSLNRKYEPTAIKPLTMVGGKIHHPTFDEYAELFRLWRFRLSFGGYLMSWERACKFARTPNKVRRGMEKVGKAQGGNPRHWFALAEPVELSRVTAEIYVAGEWVEWKPEVHGQPEEWRGQFQKYEDAIKN